MNNRIKKAAITGISTLMIFSASVLPSFAADNSNHYKGDQLHNKPPISDQAKKYQKDEKQNPFPAQIKEMDDKRHEAMKNLTPEQRKEMKEKRDEMMKKLTPEQKKEMKAKWEQKMKSLTPEQRKAIMDRFEADRHRQ